MTETTIDTNIEMIRNVHNPLAIPRIAIVTGIEKIHTKTGIGTETIVDNLIRVTTPTTEITTKTITKAARDGTMTGIETETEIEIVTAGEKADQTEIGIETETGK